MNEITMKMQADQLIRMALQEDITSEDVSTNAVMPTATKGTVDLIAKEDGVIAGLDIYARVFTILDEKTEIDFHCKDGDEVKKGELMATVTGDIRVLLSGERVALNYLQRMSGIATYTRQVAKLLEGSKVTLLDTRKTTPNCRVFEKYAVRVGGGCNHRYNLSDGVLLKDNHIGAAGSVTKAVQMAKAGYKVGILDADITGPSIPKMFGAHGQLVGDEKGMYPYETKEGIKIVSINLLMEDEEAPVVWRGPVIAGAVKQFWNEAVWGDVDYLFVDMPPGTGDVPLTVFQSLPVDGIVIVTSPQELVQMIVKKAFHMANMMHIPVLGLVENFSYLKCPDCGKKIALFGESNIDEVAAKEGTRVLGKLPLDPAYAKAADAGAFYEMENPYLDAAVDALKTI